MRGSEYMLGIFIGMDCEYTLGVYFSNSAPPPPPATVRPRYRGDRIPRTGAAEGDGAEPGRGSGRV